MTGRGHSRAGHGYAVFPEERVLRLGLASSLFPRLSPRSRAPYRVAFALVAAVVVAMAAAGLEAPTIAVSALAVPLLYLIYLYETAPPETGFAIPTAVSFVAGMVLGVAWAMVLGPVVASSLLPGLSVPLGTSGALLSAVAVPAVGQLLMLLPAAVSRLRRATRGQALDGFTAGAAGALGLTMAATLTELAPLLRAGNFIHGSSVLANVTQAVIRGVSVPLVAAAATGYVGATLWSRRDRRPTAGHRWLARPVTALAVALAVQIGLGFADDAALPDAVLLVVHLAAAAAALLVLRIGLHHVLLHERRDAPVTGASRPAEPITGAPRPGDDQRLGHARVLAVLIGGLALATAVLAGVAVVAPPAPARPCTALRCFAPFGVPAHPPHTFTSSEGWTVQWYPASAVLGQRAPTTSPTVAPDQLTLDFTNPADPAEDGELAFVGLPAQGHGADRIVASLQRANAPNAVPDYVLPGASVGYVPGYGEAFQTTPNSANGNPVRFEVVIACSIRDSYAICAYAVGPQVDLNGVVTHPTQARLALSLWADSDVNGVRWKGQTQPSTAQPWDVAPPPAPQSGNRRDQAVDQRRPAAPPAPSRPGPVPRPCPAGLRRGEGEEMTVVVGVDGSEAARVALRLAAQEARWRQVSLVAVSAYEPPLGTPVGGYPAATLHTADEERATAESSLRDTVNSELGDQAGETDLRVSAGLAGRVVVETARQTNAQLIVLAASVGKSMLPGTVSHYVLLKAHSAVMIVPADGAETSTNAKQEPSQASSGR